MADLTVKITESVTLNGISQRAENTLTISSVSQVLKRIVTIPSGSDTTIVRFNTSVHTNDGAIDVDDVKYLRVTNLDSSNSIHMALHIEHGNDDSGADSYLTFVVEAGKSFIMGKIDEALGVDDDAVSIMTDVASLHDLESIFVDSGTNNVNLELFIASA
jgi:hypothetical protein